ncbi:histidine kinase [Actinoplanes sp. NPDC026623]|uniref:sensor histidine kinase n=1 Tax=Actinoplanes sp. NPDC026623 TaxID=3155610 RepID=UPI0033CD8F01
MWYWFAAGILLAMPARLYTGIRLLGGAALLPLIADVSYDASRRVVEERLRIARDLHDVLAHSIAVINAQASVATYLSPAGDPSESGGLATAMATIAATSRTAMGELRAALGVLRATDRTESDTTGSDDRSPTPSVTHLDRLVASANLAGVDVALRTVGTSRPLPPAVDLTAYRIAQEALTNVARHAQGAATRVTLKYLASSVQLTVADSGGTPSTKAAAGHEGYGIIGMRERTRGIGGQLTARPRDLGGFEVVADLPTRQGDAR